MLHSHSKIGITWVLVGLVAMALSGCSLGPINIGGSSTGSQANGSVGATATSAPPPATATSAQESVEGKVVDAYTGQPIAGAQVQAGDILTATTPAGVFSFDAVDMNAKLSAQADGYAPGGIDTKGATSNLVIKLRPTTLTGKVTDATTGKPIAAVLVKLVLPSQPVTPTGTLTNSVPTTGTVLPAATAPATPTTSTLRIGFGKPLGAPPAAPTASGASGSDTSSDSADAPTATDVPPTDTPTRTPTPQLVPPTGEGFVAVYTDEGGNYTFKDVPDGASLTFKMPGYKLTKVDVGQANRKDVALDEFKTEGIYITANVAASPDLLGPLLDFATSSRVNAVVLNVQDDSSAWVFPVKNQEVIKAKNVDEMLPNMADLVKQIKGRGLYVIARIVTFQQKTMAEARPDWAVKSSATGKPWKGGYTAQQRWLDASNPAAQDHIIDMTKEVLALGFDEIQYDYVRFPSDPAPSEPGDMVFSTGTLTDTGKTLALQQFFKKAHDVIEPTDAFMSADVFGYTLWPDQDGKPILGVIGQVPQYLLPYTDYLSPMIYPSHFSPGEQGCAKPATCAYKLIHKSGEFAAKIFDGQRAKYRPWLEDFDWPGADYTSPGSTKLPEQLQAARETDAWGWLWWDASNQYEPRAFFKKK